ncbi:MAG: hypothetical protein IJV31_04835 [Clostridia bacterium]|nr:hypothetical protein [Clostridia bacterium]
MGIESENFDHVTLEDDKILSDALAVYIKNPSTLFINNCYIDSPLPIDVESSTYYTKPQINILNSTITGGTAKFPEGTVDNQNSTPQLESQKQPTTQTNQSTPPPNGQKTRQLNSKSQDSNYLER